MLPWKAHIVFKMSRFHFPERNSAFTLLHICEPSIFRYSPGLHCLPCDNAAIKQEEEEEEKGWDTGSDEVLADMLATDFADR